MADMLTSIVVFLFKSRGWNPAKERELAFEMSMRRKWFSHSDAQRVVAAMRSKGLVRDEGEGLAPAFPMPEGDMPADWKPDLSRVEGLEPAGKPTPARKPSSPSPAAPPTAERPQGPREEAAAPPPARIEVVGPGEAREAGQAAPKATPPQSASAAELDAESRALVESWGIAEDVILAAAKGWKEGIGAGDAGALLLAGYENGKDVSARIAWARRRDAAKVPGARR